MTTRPCSIVTALSVLALVWSSAPRAWGDSEWTFQHPLLSDRYLMDVDAADDHTLVVAGNCALLAVVRDADATVEFLPVAYSNIDYFSVIDCVDPNIWILVGTEADQNARQVVLRTDDAGVTWRVLLLLPSGGAWDVDFFDADHGAVVGRAGMIRTTADGGTTWTEAQPMGPFDTFRGVDMVDPQVVVAVGGSNMMVRTEDGGITWTQLASGVNENFTDVHFVDRLVGTVVGGDATILRTTDGGAHWIRQSVPGETPCPDFSPCTIVTDVSFRDTDTGIAIGAFPSGSGARILRTTDGGQNWTVSEYPNQLGSVSMVGDRAIACGQWGALLVTHDLGESWTTFSAGNGREFHAVSFGSAGVGFAAASGLAPGSLPQMSGGLLWRTVDGGEHWDDVAPVWGQWYDVQMLDAVVGFALGFSYEATDPFSYGVLYRTRDAGLSWQLVWSNYWPGSFVQFLDENSGWISGEYVLQRTTDGGATWTDLRPSSWESAGPVCFTSASTGVVVENPWAGGVSRIHRTTDGGATWTSVWSGGYDQFVSDVAFVDPLLGFAVTSTGLLKTTDGGVSWRLDFVPPSPARSIGFKNATEGLLVGRRGMVLRTLDGGASWTPEALPVGCIDLAGVAFAPGSREFVVGSDATILARGDVPVDVAERLPPRFQLLQNTPNPFNPSTRIRFELPRPGLTRLNVLDVRGRLVRRLVAEHLDAGWHAVEWDGRGSRGLPVASGIYVCQLIAEDRTLVRRMVMVR